MADEAKTDQAAEAAADQTADAADQSAADSATDYRERYEGQQKVNRDLERKLKDARAEADKVADLQAELAKLQGKEAEHADALKERERDAAAVAKANARILRTEIRSAAKGVLADPADALTFLDLSGFEVDEDGEVDGDAIAAALSNLVETKPYLAAQGDRRFQGDTGGGARKESRPTQLSREDLSRMSPQEINKAVREGRAKDLLTS
jgi:hypothetical protein